MSSLNQIYQAVGKASSGVTPGAPKHPSPMLTALHPASGSRATLEVTGTLPQASTWGHECGITHKPQELLHLGWESRAEEKPPYDKANNDLS